MISAANFIKRLTDTGLQAQRTKREEISRQARKWNTATQLRSSADTNVEQHAGTEEDSGCRRSGRWKGWCICFRHTAAAAANAAATHDRHAVRRWKKCAHAIFGMSSTNPSSKIFIIIIIIICCCYRCYCYYHMEREPPRMMSLITEGCQSSGFADRFCIIILNSCVLVLRKRALVWLETLL